MGTLAELKTVVAAYLGKDESIFTVGSTDLFLMAANNARKNAELLHDFERARVSGLLTIDGETGGEFGSITLEQEGFSGLKSVTSVHRSVDGQLLDFLGEYSQLARERQEIGLSNEFWPEGRYPSDAEFEASHGGMQLVQRGNALYVYNGNISAFPEGLEVYIKGYGFLSPYTAGSLTVDAPADFFLEHGFSYMQWAVMCELNYFVQRFVPRQEGVLAPPTREKESAWRDLILWDTYLIDPNSNR